MKKHTLKKEIAIVLLVKAIAITLLWWVFFSNPVSKQLTDENTAQHFFGNQTI